MNEDLKPELPGLRAALKRRLAALRTEVSDAEAERRVGADPTDVEDLEDGAARLQSDEVSDAEQARDLDEIAATDAALRRMDVGAYGQCVDCAEPIGLGRLRAQPAAARCAACQQVLEQKAARGGA